MNWTKKLWRTLPIALVIVLATAAVTFAAPPKEVKITGTPTTDYPNPHKRDANVKVNFEYISNPTVLGSTTVEAWLLDHATEEVVASARKEIEDSEPNPFINVTIPTDAPHGQLYDVKVIVRNSDGDSLPVIEKGDKKGAVIVDAEPPAKIGWVKMYEAGTPDKEVHSPIKFNTPKFKWAATTDEGSKVEKYFWEVTNKVTASPGSEMPYSTPHVVDQEEYEYGPVTALDDGTYYFHVRAVDSVGNYSLPQTLKFVVDTTAPVLKMEKPAEVGGTRWTTVRPTVEIKAVESGSGLDKASTVFEVLDSADKKVPGAEGWTGMVWTWAPNADLTGCTVYTVKMKVKDMAGNEAEQTWQFKVDDDEPTISGLVPDNDTWTNKPLKSDAVTSGYLTISAVFEDSEGCSSGVDGKTAQMWVDGHQIKLDDGNFTRDAGGVSYTPTKLRKGRNIPVKVEVKDHAGNVATAEWHFHYDPDTPELSEESPDTWTNNKRPVVSVKVKQTVSGLDLEACTFEVKKDGTKVDGTTKWNGDVWEWRPKDDLAECTPYTVTVKVTNNAGTEATKVWIFKVDTKAPKITPVSPVPEGEEDLGPDGNYWVIGSTPEIEATLADEGCAGINEKTIEMRINGQPVPKYVATKGVDGWEYDEATGTLTYVYHGNNKLKDGWYIVTVDVEDNAGNAAKTAEWEFGVDTVKPVFSDGTPEEWVGTTKPVLTVKVVEETSGLDISEDEDGEFNTFSFVVVNKYGVEIDGKGEWNGDVFTWTPDEELVEPRTYWVYVNGKDNAGNAAEEYSWFFTVDLTKPIIKNPTPEDKEAIWEEQEEVEISAEFEEWGSGIDVETAVMTVNGEEVEAVATLEDIKYTLEEPEDGRYIITVNVSDRAGNAADELKWEFYIDTTPPTDPGKPYAGNLGKDGNYYINTRRPVFYWAASVDQEPGSGLDKYKFQFGPKDEMPEPEEDEWSGAPISEDVEASEGATVEQYMHKWDVVLNVGAEYAARVKAYDRAGHGSSWVDDTTIIYDPDEPTDVTGLKVEKTVERYPTFTWNAAEDVISGVAGYTVRIKPAGSETWDVHFIEDPGTKVVTWKSVKQLDPGDYQISVTAEDVAGNKGPAATLNFTVEPIEPSVYGVHPEENKAYKVNEISTITFKVGGDFDGNVKVYVGDTQLADWRVVNVSKTVGEHKYYILLDGAVMTPGTTMTIKIDVGGMNTHDYVYEVDAERSGFGFGRLRPW